MTARAPETAMILAAGLGARMRPLTETRPKPLIKAGGRALIDWALARFADAGVKRCAVNLHYLEDQVRAHLQNRTAPEIVFSPEPELLETGGGVKNALPLLGAQPFFAANGDSIWLDGRADGQMGKSPPACARMAAAWDDAAMDVLLLVHPVSGAAGYEGRGDFLRADDGRLKRRAGGETAPYVFTGVQMIHPRAFENTPEGAFSMNIVYDAAMGAGRLYGIVHDGLWLHVGTPEGLAGAEAVLKTHHPDPRRQ